MAFRLRPDESVSPGFQRLARKALRSAHDQLRAARPDDGAIHEARKSVKKARAILALVEAALNVYEVQEVEGNIQIRV